MFRKDRYPPEVLKAMLNVSYTEEAIRYNHMRYGNWRKYPANARLEEMVKALLPKWTIGGDILELASGTGYWGQYLTSLGYEYTGLEISDGMVDYSRKLGLKIFQGDVENPFAYPTQKFDTIVCFKAFGFFPRPLLVLHNVREKLRKGGRFVNFHYNSRYRNLIVRSYSLFGDPDNVSYQPPWDERYTWKQYDYMARYVGFHPIYTRDCVVLPFRLFPEGMRQSRILKAIDDRLTHFGFVTMSVVEKPR